MRELRSVLGGLCLAALASPVLALTDDCTAPVSSTHTQDAVIYDSVSMVAVEEVCPTSDSELTDPAYHQPGTTMVKVQHASGIEPIYSAQELNPAILGPLQVRAKAVATAVAPAPVIQSISGLSTVLGAGIN